VVNEEDLKQIDNAVKARVIAAAEFATESPEPGLEELYTDVYA
jgi:pyruvate dehydrogenase E1 component alpha subunit